MRNCTMQLIYFHSKKLFLYYATNNEDIENILCQALDYYIMLYKESIISKAFTTISFSLWIQKMNVWTLFLKIITKSKFFFGQITSKKIKKCEQKMIEIFSKSDVTYNVYMIFVEYVYTIFNSNFYQSITLYTLGK